MDYWKCMKVTRLKKVRNDEVKAGEDEATEVRPRPADGLQQTAINIK